MDLARATLVLIWVLRTLINSIAKNLHKLQICLRFYSFYNKLDIQAIRKKSACRAKYIVFSFQASFRLKWHQSIFLPELDIHRKLRGMCALPRCIPLCNTPILQGKKSHVL